MAAPMLRLRRALQPSLAAVSSCFSSTATASRSPPLPSSLLLSPRAVTLLRYLPQPPPSLGGTCFRFMSTGHSRITDLKDGDEIDENTILFEGCDFNHWLITMDFPKDPKPTPEEMVRTYEETCAKGLNIRSNWFSYLFVRSYFFSGLVFRDCPRCCIGIRIIFSSWDGLRVTWCWISWTIAEAWKFEEKFELRFIFKCISCLIQSVWEVLYFSTERKSFYE